MGMTAILNGVPVEADVLHADYNMEVWILRIDSLQQYGCI